MKNKKLIKIFSIFILVTAFASCSNNTNNNEESNTNMEESVSVESNDQSLKENQMSTESDDPKASSKKEINKKDTNMEEEKTLHDEDGQYITTLLASYEGKPIEDIDAGTAYEVSLDGDKLMVKGSFNYRKDMKDYDNQVLLEGNEHNFKLADDVKFQAVGGTAPAQIFTKEEFVKIEKEVEESGLALIIQVEDGLVKSISISS